MTKSPSQNHNKLSTTIHQFIVDAFAKMGYSTFKGSLVTITEVALSIDKRVCKVYISIFDDTLYDEFIQLLEENKANLKKMISDKIKNKMRFVPSEYFFYADVTPLQASKVIQLIEKVNKQESK